MTRLSIHIVTWNSMKYLPLALQSLREQQGAEFQVIVVDNASTDGSAEFVRANYPDVILLENARNLGFARGHNQTLELARSMWQKADDYDPSHAYALVTNPDIILTANYLETILRAAEAHEDAGSIGGKLRKVAWKDPGDPTTNLELTETIDTTGLKMMKSRRAVERGAGEKDAGQFDRAGEVFGVSGALALYRMSALESVKMAGEYFDNAFFAYKEDVDLAWRLRRAGWTAYYEPRALAYHFRAAYGSERRGLGVAVTERRAKSGLVNFLSTRNHLLLLAKNETWRSFLRHAPWIIPQEIGRLLYVAVAESKTLRAYLDALRLLPSVWKKRALETSRPPRLKGWFV